MNDHNQDVEHEEVTPSLAPAFICLTHALTSPPRHKSEGYEFMSVSYSKHGARMRPQTALSYVSVGDFMEIIN